MKKILISTTLILSTIVPSSLKKATAQECPGMSSFYINENNTCIDLSNLEQRGRNRRAPRSTKRYIVVLNESTPREQISQVAEAAIQRTGGRVGHLYARAIRGFSITIPSNTRLTLAQDQRIAYIEEDLPVSIFEQTTPTGINRVNALTNPTLSIDENDDSRIDVDVAVLDTGIDLEHPDLNVVGSVSCLTTTRRPFIRQLTPTCTDGGDDDHYHGTHVAGTIGALDNSIGVVGIAPGARLWAVKVLDSNGAGYTSGILAGIDWVVEQGNIEVMNISLGSAGQSTAHATAIDNAVANGVVVVVAAGNNSDDVNNYSPAFVPNAITVSAIADFDGIPGGTGVPTCQADIDDTLADFSNYGAAVDIAAPGVCILSTMPLERGDYAAISGTSMAAPHVAGAAAVLASGASPQTIEEVTAIRDALVNGGNDSWTDESGDLLKEPLLDMSLFSATLTPTVTAVDAQ